MWQNGNRYRRRAQRLIERSERNALRGQWTTALGDNEAAETAVRAAIEAGHTRQDLRVLGGLLYNRAAYLEQLGKADQAYHAASEALAAYHRIDPTYGSPKLVALALAGGQVDSTAPGLQKALTTADPQLRNRRLEAMATEHGMSRQEVQEVIAQAADARARCHRLHARTHGTRSDPALSTTNIAAPAETYRQLIAYGDCYTRADLERIEAQYAEVRRLLDARPG